MSVTRIISREVAIVSTHHPLTKIKISLPATQQETITEVFRRSLYQHTAGKGYTLSKQPEGFLIFCTRNVASMIKLMLIPNIQTQLGTSINAEHYF